ncbi:MAG: SDR family oxidoreductase [Candidatus Kapaibacteriales bacterium]
MTRKKICVTGGAGFIGSHICDRLIRDGHEVTIIDNLVTGNKENINPSCEFLEVDIRDKNIKQIFDEREFDILFHQAAQMNVRVSVQDPMYDSDNNITGSLNLYEACKASGVKKVIFASSGGTVYGEQDYHPCKEDHPLRPISPYGIGKMVNEKYLYYYNIEFGLYYACLRYGNVYGPRQNPHGEAGVVAIFAQRLLNGKQAVINGDGLITRDYIHIDDVVEANIKAMEDGINGDFNVTTGIEHDVNYIFRELKKLTGSDMEEYHGPAKKGEQRRACCSPEKLSQYGWTPKVGFEEGLKDTVAWFKENIN